MSTQPIPAPAATAATSTTPPTEDQVTALAYKNFKAAQKTYWETDPAARASLKVPIYADFVKAAAQELSPAGPAATPPPAPSASKLD